VIAGAPRPLAEAQPGIAPDLLAICAKAMSRWPDDRYPTGKELAEDLKRYQTGQLVTAQQYSTVQLVRRWIAQRRGPVAVAAVAGVVMVAVGIGMVARIVEERNLARRESERAGAAQHEAEATTYDLKQLQAESSVRRDPTAAVAWLKQLDLDECTEDAAEILEESLASGVARHVLRETDWVYGVAFSPDGRTLSTASKDGKVRLYDLGATPPTAKVLGEHPGGVFATAFTSDGATLISSGEDGAVRMWPIAGGEPRMLGSLDGPIKGMRLSEDGVLEVRTEDDELSVWRVPSGELIGHIGRDHRLDGAMAGDIQPGNPAHWLVGYQDRHLRVVDRGGTEDIAVAPHPPRVISYAPDGTKAAVYDGQDVLVLDLAHRTLRPVGAVPGHVSFLTWSPDGSTIAAGGELTELWLLPADGGEPRVLRGHTDSIYVAKWTRDGKRILTAGDDTTARVWDLVTGGVEVLRGHEDDVITASFSPDETMVATASLDGTARVWPVGGSGVRVLGGDLDTIFAIEKIGDHEAITISTPLQVVRWNLRTGDRTELVPRGDDLYKVQHPAVSAKGDIAYSYGPAFDLLLIRADGTHATLSGHTARISGGGFGADGALYSASWDGSVRRWDVATGAGEVVATGNPVEAMVMAPSGDRMFLQRDGELSVVGLDGAALRTMRRKDLEGLGMIDIRRFSPDGNALVLQTRDGSMSLWRIDTGAVVALGDLGHHATQVTFSADGAKLAGAMADRTVRIWDTSTGTLVKTLRGHIDLAMSVAFSPDGKHVVSSSYDRTVRVWSLSSGQSRVLRGHSGAIETVAWAADGSHLLTGSRDGTLRIWPVPSTATPTPDQMRSAIRDATTAEVRAADDALASPVVEK
jgi:WD40 repeat protein